MNDTTINLTATIQHLQQSNGLSQEAAKLLLMGPDRNIIVPNTDHVSEDSIWAAFLIDCSGSMSAYRNEVIKYHADLINPLRESAKCKHGCLFVSQWLFNSSVYSLHTFRKLSFNNSASDGVTILDENIYNPNNGTALYDTVYQAIQDLAVIVDVCNSLGGITSKFIISVLTDGEDTASQIATSSDVKFLMDEFRKKHLIHSSVIVGLTKGNFNKFNVDQIRQNLGFDSYACCGNDSPKAIREAFYLMSQSAASMAVNP